MGDMVLAQVELSCVVETGCELRLGLQAGATLGTGKGTFQICLVCLALSVLPFLALPCTDCEWAVTVLMQVWSVGAGGERYQRWWGEQHLGDRAVRRHGHSTGGKHRGGEGGGQGAQSW